MKKSDIFAGLRRIFTLFLIIIFSLIIAIFLVFFDFFSSIIFGGNVTIINTTPENFTGKIAFFQHKNLLFSENFEILQNQQKKFTVPDTFNDGDITIFVENISWKNELTISNDYLYSFNVNEKIVIKKDNENIILEKNPY